MNSAYPVKKILKHKRMAWKQADKHMQIQRSRAWSESIILFVSCLISLTPISPGWKPIRVEKPGRVWGLLTPGSGSPLKPGVISSASQKHPLSPALMWALILIFGHIRCALREKAWQGEGRTHAYTPNRRKTCGTRFGKLCRKLGCLFTALAECSLKRGCLLNHQFHPDASLAPWLFLNHHN